MRPRIAYIINSVEGGGAALPVPAIVAVLRDAGADVRVFALTPRDRRAMPALDQAGVDTLVREGGDRDHIVAARWLRGELRAWHATHLWTSLSRATILGLLLGPMLGLPVICWQHNAFLKPWNRRLLRLLQARARLWVADSSSVAELSGQRLGIPADRLATWPIYAADTSAPAAAAWSPGQMLMLGSLGRLHPNKGYDLLIAALARLQADGFRAPVPFRLTIAGEGAERDRLTTLAQQAGITELHLAGYTPRPKDFLAGLHLYLQPSRAEGFCIAAHEALTAGVPVIGSAVGEMAHTITPGQTGWLVPPGDVCPLQQTLREALAQPSRLAAMGQTARSEMLERFSPTRFAAIGQAIWNRAR